MCTFRELVEACDVLPGILMGRLGADELANAANKRIQTYTSDDMSTDGDIFWAC